MNERRRERLAAFLQEELPYFVQEQVPLPEGVFASILHVEIAESGTRANIFMSVFPDSAREGVAKELNLRENEATYFVRTRLRSKYSPVIRFHVAR